jgi:Holliday junction resolvase-like predicted endonuclease
MRTPSQRTGDAAESSVAERLVARRWQILARQVRVGRAELDIVAVDPGPPPALVIVEVRWRARRDFGLAEDTVDGRKRGRLHRAGFTLRETGALPGGVPLPRLPLRFDLIVVEPAGHMRHHRHGA